MLDLTPACLRSANPQTPCGDTWVCQVVIALREIVQATTCISKKRPRLIVNRNVRSSASFAIVCEEARHDVFGCRGCIQRYWT